MAATSSEELDQIRKALLKTAAHRSYDELLLLKQHISKTEFIKNTLSAGMFPKQMDELCRNLGIESYHEGDMVFRQNDVGDRMYIVLAGACEVRLRQRVELAHGESEMREKVLFTCMPGQHFGEKALMNDEPRAASIVCSASCDLITISKGIYNALLKSAHADAAASGAKLDKPGTKGFALKVLAKRREMRTALEIEAVASYLNWRIPFFKKFSPDQQLELCRVADAVSVWGRSVLFKQGSIGQAFYIVLSGSVEIWVANAEQMAANNALALAAANGTLNLSQKAATEIMEQGLGVMVATLTVGDIFGERALENEDSMRMASVLTCDQTTDLIIISREDYHKLVSALMHEETMTKITLLRKTDIFKDVEAYQLKELARYMVKKRYELDDTLFTCGSKAFEMIITDVGECRVEVPVESFTVTNNTNTLTNTATNTNTTTNTNANTATSIAKPRRRKKEVLELGRIAPGSVLASYITQVNLSIYHM